MDEARRKAIEDDIENAGNRGSLFDYVDTTKLERLGLERYKPSRGNNFIRIIAPHSTGFFRAKVWIHSQIGANNRTLLCLRKTFDEPCPVCEYRESLKEKDPEDPKISVLYPGRRYLLFVFDVKNEESEDKGLRWFDCPPSLYEDIVKLSKDKRSGEVIDVSNPKDGRDIEFEQNKVKGRIRYESVKLVPTDPLPKDWYTDVPEFNEVLLKPSYEAVKKELVGLPPSSETEDKGEAKDDKEVAEEPTSRRSRRGTRSQDSQEQSDKTEDDKEVAEEPTSRRSRRGTKDDADKVNEDVKQRIKNIRNKVRKESNE